MFPERITAGYILTIAGNAYVVTHCMPDAFVTRSLDVASHAETFSFEELIETYVEGMLRIEPPRPPARPDDGPDALWSVVCQTYERIVPKGPTDLSDASIKAVMRQLMDAQVRYLADIGKGPTAEHRPKLVLPYPGALRARMLRFRTQGPARARSDVRPAGKLLAAFDPVVAKMTWEAATMFASSSRPTVKALYRELTCRLDHLPERRSLRVPSLSTFQRVVAALPRDLVDTARHGAAKAASLSGGAA